MIPDNRLSTTTVRAAFTGARGLAVTKTVDYEDGGIGIQDPSQGSQVQIWRARLLGNDVWVDAPNTEPFVLYSAPGITEVSLSFDQNMRPALAFVQNGAARLRWFDSVPGQTVITTFSGIRTPRVLLDDKRFTQTSNSDILLAYVRNDGALCYRQQRDRFQVERVLDAGPYPGLIKLGFNRQLRVQFLLEPPQ